MKFQHSNEPEMLLPFQESLPMVLIMSRLDLVYYLTVHLFMIHFNIIRLSAPSSFMLSLSTTFSYSNSVYNLLRSQIVLHALSPHTPWFDQQNNIWGSTTYAILYHAIFSIVLLLPPRWVQILHSEPFPQGPSVYVVSLIIPGNTRNNFDEGIWGRTYRHDCCIKNYYIM
jgi:hypothetical protein